MSVVNDKYIYTRSQSNIQRIVQYVNDGNKYYKLMMTKDNLIGRQIYILIMQWFI